MASRLENLIKQYIDLVSPPHKMNDAEMERAGYLLTTIVKADPNMYSILSSAVQQAPEHMAVDEAFVYALRHPAVEGYVATAA